MRVFFAGSPRLAVPSLEAVSRIHEVCGVLTNPDRPAGRQKQYEPTPVNVKAVELSLPVFQPDQLNESFIKVVKALEPDILVCAAFGRIFKKGFLDIFPFGGINLHPSLLPRHRGPSPISAAILAGDTETGITIQRLSLTMDSGDILAAEIVPLTGMETTCFLSEKLSHIGAGLLIRTLDSVAKGTACGTPQGEEDATYCRLVKKEDGLIDWNNDAVKIERMIRAYDPWPRAFTFFNALHLNILSGGIYPEPMDSVGKEKGLVLGFNKRYGILVNTGKGVLFITRLQLQSRKVLDWRSFLNGQRNFIGALLGG